MSDRGGYHADEYESMDEYELLESLDNEGKKSGRSSKSKIFTIVGGLLLGALAVYLFSDKGASVLAPPIQEAENVLPKIDPVEVEPKKEPSADPEPSIQEKKPESVDERLAKLQQQNLIGEDLAAPGAIGEEPPDTTVKKSEPESPAIPTPKTRKEVTPKHSPVKTAKPDAPIENGPYSVKVIATPNAVRALERRDRLEALGYRAQIIKKGRAIQSRYAVETESFTSIGAAARQSQHFAHSGFQSKIAYVGARKKVILSLGSFSSRKLAEKNGGSRQQGRVWGQGEKKERASRFVPCNGRRIPDKVGSGTGDSEASRSRYQLNRSG